LIVTYTHTYIRRNRSENGWETPKFRDEPSTPKIHVKDTPSRSSWDDDDLAWPHQKVGKEIKPREENVAIRPTVARQSAVTEEEDLIGRKEEIDDHPTGLNAAILIGLKEETDEATIDLNDEVPTYPNAVNGSPILITSKFVLN
jgi:hypothetical protein